jgi:hypothetical protein
MGAMDTVKQVRPSLFVELNSLASFRRFSADLPSSYEPFFVGGKGDPVPVPAATTVWNVRDVLFVDRSRKGQLFEKLASR